MIMQSKLNATNKFEAIKALAVVTYNLNIITWNLNNTNKLDIKTRKILTMTKMHHRKANVDRLYLPKTTEGRGMVQLELTFKTTLDTYLTTTDHPLLQIVKHNEELKKMQMKISIRKEASKFRQQLDLPDIQMRYQPNMPVDSNKKQNTKVNNNYRKTGRRK